MLGLIKVLKVLLSKGQGTRLGQRKGTYQGRRQVTRLWEGKGNTLEMGGNSLNSWNRGTLNEGEGSVAIRLTSS